MYIRNEDLKLVLIFGDIHCCRPVPVPHIWPLDPQTKALHCRFVWDFALHRTGRGGGRGGLRRNGWFRTGRRLRIGFYDLLWRNQSDACFYLGGYRKGLRGCPKICETSRIQKSTICIKNLAPLRLGILNWIPITWVRYTVCNISKIEEITNKMLINKKRLNVAYIFIGNSLPDEKNSSRQEAKHLKRLVYRIHSRNMVSAIYRSEVKIG